MTHECQANNMDGGRAVAHSCCAKTPASAQPFASLARVGHQADTGPTAPVAPHRKLFQRLQLIGVRGGGRYRNPGLYPGSQTPSKTPPSSCAGGRPGGGAEAFPDCLAVSDQKPVLCQLVPLCAAGAQLPQLWMAGPFLADPFTAMGHP